MWLFDERCLSNKIPRSFIEVVRDFFFANYGAPFWKKLIFFWAQNICLCSIILFLLIWNTFFVQQKLCWHETVFRATSTWFYRHQITFCATSNFFFRHKIVFRVTLIFLFGALFRMLFHGDVFLLSRSNKNVITCQIFYIQFYIVHWQPVNLLRSGRNKETFNSSITLPDTRK